MAELCPRDTSPQKRQRRQNAADGEAYPCKEENNMWYAVQVTSGQEFVVKGWVDKTCLAEECFIPIREIQKKYRGKWNLVKEQMTPGYLFVITDTPELLMERLYTIPRFAKLLGWSDMGFIPLSEKEINILQHFGDSNHISHLSQVEVSEGNHVRVIAGDLKNFEGDIVRIDLHRRIAVVRIPFMGKTADIHLGIDLVKKV